MNYFLKVVSESAYLGGTPVMILNSLGLKSDLMKPNFGFIR